MIGDLILLDLLGSDVSLIGEFEGSLKVVLTLLIFLDTLLLIVLIFASSFLRWLNFLE